MAWLPPRGAAGGCWPWCIRRSPFSGGRLTGAGSVAAFGGALVLVALGRLLAGPRIREGLLMGLGMAVLANSRPFEGLVLTVLALLVLAGVAVRHGPPARAWLGRFALPLCWCWHRRPPRWRCTTVRVTGDPLRMPYMVYMADYAVAPNFLWQAPQPEPAYRHAEIRRFHIEWELRRYLSQTTVGIPAAVLAEAHDVLLVGLADGAPGGTWLPVLQVPLLALPWALRDRRMRLCSGDPGRLPGRRSSPRPGCFPTTRRRPSAWCSRWSCRRCASSASVPGRPAGRPGPPRGRPGALLRRFRGELRGAVTVQSGGRTPRAQPDRAGPRRPPAAAISRSWAVTRRGTTCTRNGSTTVPTSTRCASGLGPRGAPERPVAGLLPVPARLAPRGRRPAPQAHPLPLTGEVHDRAPGPVQPTHGVEPSRGHGGIGLAGEGPQEPGSNPCLPCLITIVPTWS